MRQPREASTRRQLATIRNTLKKVKLPFSERYEPGDGTSYFALDLGGPSEMSELLMVHQPGCLSMHAVFGVRVPKKNRAELERFATIFNRTVYEGCLVVQENGDLVHRVALNYRRVKDLDGAYVSSLLGTIMERIELIDLPLILIAKGATARGALKKVWESSDEQRLRLG